jgi:hypothetical protein
MNPLDPLIACAGGWHGTNILQDPGTIQPTESKSTATVTPLLGGRFVRIDYTWSYQEKPQEGSILVGFNPQSGRASVHWIDGWHNGFSVMACDGTIDERGAIDVRGSYPAPPGPDWGWRTVITPAADALQVVMHNVWPEGKEELAVEARFARI